MICSTVPLLLSIKQQLMSTWAMKDLGPIAYYLGLNIKRDRRRRLLWIGQPKYIACLLNKYDVNERLRPSTPLPSGFKPILEGEMLPTEDGACSPFLDKKGQRLYQSIIGALNFAAGCSRPDIAYAVGKLASVNHCPRARHLPVAIRCLQYLAATPDLSITFSGARGQGDLALRGASDADWAGCPITRRSTTGYVFCLAGGPVSWASKKQSELALSSCESEYVALTAATKEANWIRDLLNELGFPRKWPTPILVDNQSAIELSKHPLYHSRTKHIQLAFHYVRQEQAKRIIDVVKVNTAEQPADFLTKNIGATQLQAAKAFVGLRDAQ